MQCWIADISGIAVIAVPANIGGGSGDWGKVAQVAAITKSFSIAEHIGDVARRGSSCGDV